MHAQRASTHGSNERIVDCLDVRERAALVGARHLRKEFDLGRFRVQLGQNLKSVDHVPIMIYVTQPPNKHPARTHQAADAAEAVDADVDGAGRLGTGVGGVDDVDKLGLERGAAHEEAVDVGLGRQLVGVLGCGWSVV